MDKAKNKAYWSIFVIDLIKDVAFIPAIMSLNSFGFFIGFSIYVLDGYALVKSVINLELPSFFIWLLIETIKGDN